MNKLASILFVSGYFLTTSPANAWWCSSPEMEKRMEIWIETFLDTNNPSKERFAALDNITALFARNCYGTWYHGELKDEKW